MSKRRASVIFEHFDIPDNAQAVCKAKCKHCPVEMSFNRKATSNLLNHMKRKHAAVPLESTSSQAKQRKPLLSALTTPTEKWSSTDPRQMQADRALVSLVAGKLLPVSLVQSSLFYAFMQETQPAYNIPSRQHFVHSLLREQHTLLHNKLQEHVKSAQSVCLTVALRSGKKASAYMGVTGHMIINYALKTVLFACKRVKGKHTADSILKHYEQTVAAYNMSSKIASVVMDNTSNVGQACDLPGFLPQAQASQDSSDSESDLDGDSVSDDSLLESLPQHESCFAHSLQLVVRDGLKSSTQTTKVLAKVSSIVAHIRESTTATDLLEEQPKTQAANATRWNSQLKRARSVLSIDKEKLDSLDTAPLTARDRLILKDFISIMTPFEEVEDRIQGDRVVTASLVIPSIRGIKRHLRSPSEYNSKLVTALMSSTEKHLSKYEDRTPYQRAAVLDPRLKLCCYESDQSSRLKEDLLTLASTFTIDSHLQVEEYSPPPCKKSCIFPFFEDEPQVDVTSPHAQEVETYLQEPCIPYNQDPLAFWKGNQYRFPRLSQLAQHYLCIPASSAPVQRLFSTAGKGFHPERTRLSDSNFETLMFIKANSGLV
ncbi:zinc finger BED domain-containing protein 4-like [Huso huso]|uniref:Zinc finger BED domain-containing protein 4-like n=1 Tax=Huso huso TaxID=61971 RepID=A0ABR0ZFR8_HUSHU